MRRTLTPLPISLRDPLMPAREAANASFIQSAIHAMRQLDRMRRFILLALAILASLITFATIVYAFLPDPPAQTAGSSAHGTQLSNGEQASPSLSGSFALIGTPGSQEWLSLQQFGDHVTGKLTTFTCQNSATQVARAIVTGTLLSGGQLKLTVAMPSDPHSQTTVYALSLTASGFTLTWSDTGGHVQTQQWAQASMPSTFTGCTASQP